jgi:hypothetical protein
MKRKRLETEALLQRMRQESHAVLERAEVIAERILTPRPPPPHG